ncbi:uncharacterized protein LOC126904378 [Daktulosphaira vitifoliae]|uniref:uncharacterized protein LOC126904378 n=1 Tax=Daktulosphaira vitifoliae TaxID=58002 RepID=UPI0021A9B2C4|nr:uncharacterized protein LOC126904378 [Daktulosphaira vitifoliae]
MSGDVRIKHIEFTTTQIKDIDIENILSVGGVFTVKQESGDDKIPVESMNLHVDANELSTSHIIVEDDHPNNRTTELEVTAIEEAVFMETRKHEEGVIRYFGRNNKAERYCWFLSIL